MSLPARRLTTLVLLACYLAGGTFGGLWHNHEHHELSGRGHALISDAQCVEHASQDGDHPQSLYDDDCSVCRFLGQLTLPPQLASLSASPALVEELTTAEAITQPGGAHSLPHSRGPPALA